MEVDLELLYPYLTPASASNSSSEIKNKVIQFVPKFLKMVYQIKYQDTSLVIFIFQHNYLGNLKITILFQIAYDDKNGEAREQVYNLQKNEIPLISKGDNLTESLLLHLLSTMNEKYKEF